MNKEIEFITDHGTEIHTRECECGECFGLSDEQLKIIWPPDGIPFPKEFVWLH